MPVQLIAGTKIAPAERIPGRGFESEATSCNKEWITRNYSSGGVACFGLKDSAFCGIHYTSGLFFPLWKPFCGRVGVFVSACLRTQKCHLEGKFGVNHLLSPICSLSGMIHQAHLEQTEHRTHTSSKVPRSSVCVFAKSANPLSSRCGPGEVLGDTVVSRQGAFRGGYVR